MRETERTSLCNIYNDIQELLHTCFTETTEFKYELRKINKRIDRLLGDK